MDKSGIQWFDVTRRSSILTDQTGWLMNVIANESRKSGFRIDVLVVESVMILAYFADSAKSR